MSNTNVHANANTSPVTLTKEAAIYIEKTIAEHPNAKGLRLGIKSAGCSGYSYLMEVAVENLGEELKFHSQGIDLFIDPQSIPFLKGTILHCETQGLNQIIKFKNPNIKDECGCGESFSLED